MKKRNIIVLGDRTTHGGTVISAWGQDGDVPKTINGKPVVCVGDKVTCPKCRGTHTILEGAENPPMYLNGRQIALEGCRVSDNSQLLSAGQDIAWHTSEGDGAEEASGAQTGTTAKGIQTADAMTGISAEVARMLKRQKETSAYDEQVQLFYTNEKNEPAKNVTYKLVEKSTNKVLAEGKTDEKGLTQRISTCKPEEISIIIFRRKEDASEEEKETGVCKTNDKKDSIQKEGIIKQFMFFDIYYQVKDNAFARAARTVKKIETREYVFNPYSDIWLSFEFKTESEFKEIWKKIYTLQQNWEMEVMEGHLFTHASISFLGIAGTAGMEFRIDKNEDGTLTFPEIARLEKLKWTQSSRLFLNGCRTGRYDLKEGGSIAHSFFANQGVKLVYGQMGFAYFSYSSSEYKEIKEDPNDAQDVYLWAFGRKKNAYLLYAKDDNKAMPLLVLRR